MRKNSFVEGTIIATVAIFLVKIIGMLYVIPFYAIVGVKGAALYAYAYNIYGLFLEISTAGLPNAIGKLVNEFNTLNMQEAKIRAFKLGKKMLTFIAIIAFIILVVFAKDIATLILGDLKGGNTIQDVTFVIRCVSLAILVFPFLSVSRGFFQGHNIISVSSFSQVIEQLARVVVIIGGSFIALKVLHLDLTHTIGIAVFGAFVGGLCSLIYVKDKLRKNKQALALDVKFEKKDDISNKEIIKKIITYAIPTIVISLAFSLYNNIDMILILRTMDFLGFEPLEVEFIASGISTWAAKISVIITSVGLGLSASLIPNMVEAFTLKKYDDVNRKFIKAMELILFGCLPMCFGIALLSKEIWTVFYGLDFIQIGTNILAFGIFAPLFSNLFTISNYTLQSMNKFKMVYKASISGILVNTILDIPMMLLFNLLGIPAYLGATFASIIGYSVTVILAMHYLNKEYHFKYKEIIKTLKKIAVPLITMLVVVILIKLVIKIDYTNRLLVVGYIGLVSMVGAIVYFLVAFKMGLTNDILGNDLIKRIKGKFKRNKKEV